MHALCHRPRPGVIGAVPACRALRLPVCLLPSPCLGLGSHRSPSYNLSSTPPCPFSRHPRWYLCPHHHPTVASLDVPAIGREVGAAVRQAVLSRAQPLQPALQAAAAPAGSEGAAATGTAVAGVEQQAAEFARAVVPAVTSELWEAAPLPLR